jgi:uncharacterized membrane protein
MGAQVYELLVFILLSVILECGMGIVYGVAVGYDPILVFPAAILLNFLSIITVIFIVDRLLARKKGLRDWVERRLGRGKKIICKYGYVGIVLGVFVLSPIQLAIVGRLLGMRRNKLYPSLLAATFLVATAFLCIALGIFKVLLA